MNKFHSSYTTHHLTRPGYGAAVTSKQSHWRLQRLADLFMFPFLKRCAFRGVLDFAAVAIMIFFTTEDAL